MPEIKKDFGHDKKMDKKLFFYSVAGDLAIKRAL